MIGHHHGRLFAAAITVVFLAVSCGDDDTGGIFETTT